MKLFSIDNLSPFTLSIPSNLRDVVAKNGPFDCEDGYVNKVVHTTFFSIIVPVYNTERYLEQCIKSILSQQEESYEVILVDDGSTDQSPIICDRYTSLYPERVSVIHQENKGLLMARREGLRYAKGAYIMHLDSDDYIRKDALVVIRQALHRTGADLLLFEMSRQENFSSSYVSIPFAHDEKFSGEGKRSIFELVCRRSSINNLCSKVTKREIVDFDRDYSSVAYVKNGEDLLQSLPLFDAAKQIVYIDERLYFYRKNPESITRLYNPDLYFSSKTVQKARQSYAAEWDAGDGYLNGLAKDKAREACINVMKHIIRSSLSCDQKEEKLKEITEDSFYLSLQKKPRTWLGIKYEFVAYVVERRMEFMLKFISRFIK